MSEFGTGTAKLASGRGLSVAIGLCVAPIISRLYGPADYGVARYVQIAANLLGAFACLGYAQAIPMARDRSEAAALARLCLLLTALLLIPVVALTALGGPSLSASLRGGDLSEYLWLIPAMFLLRSLVRIVQSTCTSQRRFTLLTVLALSSDNSVRAVHILLAWLMGGAALYLLLGRLAGLVVAVLVGAVAVVPLLLLRPVGEAGPGPSLRSVARAHSQFPKGYVWSNLVSVASLSLPVVFLGWLFDRRVVGLYTFGERKLMLLMVVLGQSLGQEFYPEAAAEWRAAGTMRATIRRSVRITAVLAAFPVVAVALLGPLLFRTVFGRRWYDAGLYAQLLSPWLLLLLVSAPLTAVFLIARRVHLLVFFNALLVLSRCLALVVGHWLGGAAAAMACLSAAGVAVLVYRLALSLRLGRAGWASCGCVVREVARSALLLLPAGVAFWAGDHRYVALALFAAACTVHGVWLVRREPEARRMLGSLLARLRPRHRRD